jgi:large subunit ribosomal protein L15
MDLSKLTNNPGARHRPKRLGIGLGSGKGKTSGKGQKGQKARSGVSFRAGWEGGQNPLYRRLPKRGFTSFTLHTFAVVNVESLNVFKEGDIVTPASFKKSGIVTNYEGGIKVLGNGTLKKKLTVVADAFSKTAIEKIQKIAGECRVALKADSIKDFRGIAALDLASTKPVKA